MKIVLLLVIAVFCVHETLSNPLGKLDELETDNMNENHIIESRLKRAADSFEESSSEESSKESSEESKCQGTLGQWSEWSDWSECSVNGGQVNQQRKRICTGPGDCIGYYQEYKECKGILGEWSLWSECSATCGQGKQQRKRKCIGPGDCDGLGPLEEVRNCPNLPRCKGILGEWSLWSECSATCGQGKQQRKRKCIGPGDCDGLGPLEEVRNCPNLPRCKGILGEWSQWSECSATCGQGKQQRKRKCIGPGDCDGLGPLEEERDCPDLPSCKGTLGEWSTWSKCSATCGQGNQQRKRKCIGPGDCDGLGPLEEVRNCPNLPRCKGILGEWSLWSECSATCGQGKQQRKRKCIGPGDCDGLGPLEEVRNCPNLPRCKGILGEWSLWSECSATCGQGKQQRKRKCIGPGDCDGLGPLEEVRNCPNLPRCKGILGEWSLWSECSATCGQGKQQRKRKCIGPGDCDGLGPLEEVRNCPNLPRCKGILGEWSLWSECSATCGQGKQQRKRKCIGPGDCDGLGPLEEVRNCPNLPRCKGILGEWSQWSECSATCGQGKQQRKRKCTGPGVCIGRLEEERYCPDLPKCQCTIKKEQCQFATVAPVYYTQCKNDDTICSGGGGESDPCEGDSPDPEEDMFCTAKMAEISDLTDAQKPWVKCSEDCFVGSNPKNFTETTGCTAEVRQCKFPFVFNGKTYEKCTNDVLFEDDAKIEETFHWCATSTNDDDSMKRGKWGICDPSNIACDFY